MLRRIPLFVAATIICCSAFFIAIGPVFAFRGYAHHKADVKNTVAILLMEYVAVLALMVSIAAFRSRPWGRLASLLLAGFGTVWTASRICLIRGATHSAKEWIFFFLCVLFTVLLRHVPIPFERLVDQAPRRPVGVTAMAWSAFLSIPLLVLMVWFERTRPLPRWQIASERFEMLLCLVLAIGLWHLQEWARIVSEFVSFLVPLQVLPLLLTPSNHKPFSVAIATASLGYAFWSIWYLRRSDVVSAFEGINGSGSTALAPFR